ncbi:thioredoxin family protein [Candidatus Vampirococcus lugosii]|uniref:Thioredoxin n=1 Tax=Candidatus Vampirococcus lugosii TaxID=2789015 RepID=A0ABS5QJP6_9BACT|nr:thioredoxin family protein [Candidatus Vampirococcus lugosii]MBS8121477.1 thioredoxin [Candidatus Vampirococcus lugosii]
MKIVFVGAMWCASCFVMKPIMNDIKKEFENLDISFYDYDQDNKIVEKYNINDILPVIVFVDDNGNELKKLEGEYSKKELINIIQNLN